MGAFAKGRKLDKKLLKRDKVPAPELGEGGHVLIRALSGLEIQAQLADRNEENPASDFALVAMCVIDGDGQPIFTATSDENGTVTKTAEQDARENFDVSAETQLAVVEKILRISGIAKDRAKN